MIYDIEPVAKPRMTRQDSWPKPPPRYKGQWPRPAVVKYRAFEGRVRIRRLVLPPCGAFITFGISMPKSWPDKKKARMNRTMHEQTPDLSNLIKALEDACYADDRAIWNYAGLQKIWVYQGFIEITESKATMDLANQLREKQNAGL